MLDVDSVSGFPGKLFSPSEAALTGTPPDQNPSGRDPTAFALDRLEAALARIAHAQAEAASVPRHPTPPAIAEPEWAEDVANRLDALIAELRRALSGEPL